MKLGSTNKIHQSINEAFGQNAELLEQSLKEVNWKYFAKLYGIAFGIFTVSVFVLIVVVRFAFVIF